MFQVIENIKAVLRADAGIASSGRTVIVVAHNDRVFDAVGVTRVIRLGRGGVIVDDKTITPCRK